MRPAYFAWIFPSLARDARRAEARSDPAEMRRERRRAQVVTDRIEVALGAGSVVKGGAAGAAHAPADKIGALARLRDDLREYAGQSSWGVGLTLREAEIARDYAAKRGEALVAYSPALGGGELSKTEGGPIEEVESQPEPDQPMHRIEAELRDHADRYEERQAAEGKVEADKLSSARAKAAAAVEALRASGKLARQAETDPETHEAVMALVEATQEALAKGGTFKGLPVPRIAKLRGSPVGTILLGKIKVATAEGDKWRGALSGLIRDAQPASEGGRTGAVVSAKAGR